jgi:fido (protein-threonine AMPylation protein)
MVKEWHREILTGLDVPDPAFVGRFRGERGAKGVAVRVGRCYGTPSREVATEAGRFLAALTDAVEALDEVISPGEAPDTAEALDAVLTLAALSHAHWIAIHPFANGNGRTARLWANWVAMRYSLPAFVRLRPRPEGDDYHRAARAALCEDDFELSVPVFRRMFDRYMDDVA